MRKLLIGSAVIFALLLPAMAQWHGRLSPSDQSKFDSYFSRWQEYKRTDNRDQVTSMERRMQDLMSHYRIPSNVPYWQVASNGSQRDWRDHDRDHDNDRYGQQGPNWNRGHDRYRRLSPSDQSKFNSYYSRWQEYRRTNNRDQVISMEKRMRNLMAQYNIPPNVPFGEIASH